MHARLPSEDTAQKLLFSGSEVFPGGSFRSDLAVTRRLAYLDGSPSRSKVQGLLTKENAFAELTPQQKVNLEAAGSDRALFLITGQQPGLFGGAVLWFYKALTCAALAREWSARLSLPVIPIFWAAGDDADLQECNHLELLEERASEVHGPLSLPFTKPAHPIPVSTRHLDATAIAALLARLTPLWNSETIETLRRAYSVPGTLTTGFLRLAQSQLGKEGILFVDGYSPNLRALARPVLELAIKKWATYQAALLKGTEIAKAAGIQTQVPLRPGVVHAFSLLGGVRHRLYGETMVGGADRIYTPEQPTTNLLSNLAGLDLTHDVFTRPLIADAVFPVLGHVLGPAELRYFAQMSKLFPEITGDMPLLHPRMTAAVASHQAWKDFQGEGLEISDLVRVGPAGLRTKLEDRIWKAHPASSALSEMSGEKWIAGLRKMHSLYFPDQGPMQRYEKTLGAAWKRYLRSLERMAFARSARTKENLFKHLHWLGGGMGQDRHLNFPSLLYALGKEGLENFRTAVDPMQPEPQLFLFSKDEP